MNQKTFGKYITVYSESADGWIRKTAEVSMVTASLNERRIEVMEEFAADLTAALAYAREERRRLGIDKV